MEDFVSFELAKKLKEKGFEIPTRSIVAMYNEQGVFFTLTTAADYQVSPSGYKYRCYYGYDDFDELDYIAPTISQVLKWLRKYKEIYCLPYFEQGIDMWLYSICRPNAGCEFPEFISESIYNDYEEAAIAGVNYCLENLI